MKAVILDGYTVNPGDLSWKPLEDICSLTVYDRTSDADIISRIGDCEAVFTSKCRITAEIMAACPSVKFIGVLATGYDNIDIKEAASRAIAVCNVPSYSTESVTQHTFALLLELCNHVGLHNQAVQEGKWSSCPDFSMVMSPMFQLSGKSMGIIGYGTIGKRVSQVAEALGMKVYAYSQAPEEAVTADVVSLHCPAVPQNRGFVNKEFINRMKTGAMLINTARGALLNEYDLADALRSGKLAGAALDVVSTEPIASTSPLLNVPNLLITAHMAWTSREAREIICTVSADNLNAFIKGQTMNRVDIAK